MERPAEVSVFFISDDKAIGLQCLTLQRSNTSDDFVSNLSLALFMDTIQSVAL
jgi:hypothetical protein